MTWLAFEYSQIDFRAFPLILPLWLLRQPLQSGPPYDVKALDKSAVLLFIAKSVVGMTLDGQLVDGANPTSG
jgi:hypothetical protein